MILSGLFFQHFTWRWIPDKSVLFSWSSSNDARSDDSLTILRFASGVIFVADADKLSNEWLVFIVGVTGGLKRLSLERPGDKILNKIKSRQIFVD